MSYTGVLGAIPSSSTPLKTTIIQDPLSASSNIQLDANGNTYLVPVTGNVGIGTTSPGYKLTTVGTSAAGGIYSAISNTDATAGSLAGYVGIANGTNNYFVLSQAVGGVTTLSNAGAAGLTIQTAQAQPLIFSTTATERMRIDSSGNVGIGTTSPNARLSLNVSGAGSVTALNLTNDNTGFASGTGPAINFGVASSAGSYGKLEVLNQTATTGSNSYMAFSTRGGDVLAERMRIDASGNVGIGTTSPSTYGKLAVSGNLYAGDTTTNSDGTITIGSTGAGSVAITRTGVGATSSSMTFSTTFATLQERMRIDSSGNVGIGTTSTYGAKMFVLGSANSGVAVSDNSNTIAMYGNGGTAVALGTANSVPMFFTTGGTERMRIDSSGNVGIGTSSPTSRLHVYTSSTEINRLTSTAVNGGYQVFYADNATPAYLGSLKAILASGNASDFAIVGSGANNMVFGTNSSERMRIDSSGNLLVGAISSVNGGCVISVAAGTVCSIITAATASTNMIVFRNGNGNVGSIATSGTATSYNTGSDYRLKHDVESMTFGLATLAALKPVTYKWNVDDSDGEGFIAHELAEVIPLAVTGAKDAIDEDGKPVHQGVDYSKIVVHLVAALQELKAEFDAYKASHA